MTASVKALQGPLRVPTDSGIHEPILNSAKSTSEALAASVSAIMALGFTEEQAKKMVGAPAK